MNALLRKTRLAVWRAQTHDRHASQLPLLLLALVSLATTTLADDASENTRAANLRRTDGVLRRVDPVAGASFWSFRSPQEHALPSVTRPNSTRQSLDTFILARLDAAGLEPSQRATKEVLLRRATFDLIGLPPTPAELADFLADDSPLAFERVVDRLLASPHFGERWGRHWLDIVRYSDSNGLDENIHFGHAWRYRDYVVSALNRDKPYDRFLAEHLAGDLLSESNEDVESYLDRITAGSFLAIGPKMVAEQDDRKRAMDTLDEIINVVSRAFLAQTVACARCHDHKYDPISTRDYYALAGIFASAVGEQGLHRSVPASRDPQADQSFRERVRTLQRALDELDRKSREQLAAEHDRAGRYIELAVALSERTTRLGENVFETVNAPPAKATSDDPEGKTVHRSIYRVPPIAGGEYLLAAGYENTRGVTQRLFVDGELVRDDVFSALTAKARRARWEHWFAIAQLNLPPGPHILQLECNDDSPRVGPLVLIPVTPAESTRNGWASRGDLNASLLLRWVDVTLTERHRKDSLLAPVLASSGARRKQEALALGRRLASLYRETKDLKRELVERRMAREGPAVSRLVVEHRAPLWTPRRPDDYFPALANRRRELTAKLQAARKEMRALPQVHAMHTEAAIDLPVHVRGSHLHPERDPVPRGFLSVIRESWHGPSIPQNSSGRLELARWLGDSRHPLTSRVMVNRVWQILFGVGLVATPSNFGFRGERPSHPELLDHLALQLSRNGWSLKKLVRNIVLSSTYAQSSRARSEGQEKDPENRLLWRQNRRRLEAEAIRDNLLATAGTLDRQVGGSIFEYRDGQRVTNDQSHNASTSTYATQRRALYIPVIRMALYPMFTDFDLNDTTLPIPRRGSTVVASQALFMMNSPLVTKSASVFASRLLASPSSTRREHLRGAYLRAFGRAAREREIEIGLNYLKETEERLRADDGATPEQARQTAWQNLCHTLLGTNEFIYID